MDILHHILRTTGFRWGYSTRCELKQPLGGVTDCDFVLQGDRITVNGADDDGWDGQRFPRYFSKSVEEAAEAS